MLKQGRHRWQWSLRGPVRRLHANCSRVLRLGPRAHGRAVICGLGLGLGLGRGRLERAGLGATELLGRVRACGRRGVLFRRTFRRLLFGFGVRELVIRDGVRTSNRQRRRRRFGDHPGNQLAACLLLNGCLPIIARAISAQGIRAESGNLIPKPVLCEDSVSLLQPCNQLGFAMAARPPQTPAKSSWFGAYKWPRAGPRASGSCEPTCSCGGGSYTTTRPLRALRQLHRLCLPLRPCNCDAHLGKGSCPTGWRGRVP